MLETVQARVKDTLGSIADSLTASLWSEEAQALRALAAQVDDPCVIVVAGMVKAGKSSFLNALLNGDYAPVGTTATTATINYFSYGTPEKGFPVACHWRNGLETRESQDFLQSLQGNDDATLLKAEGIAHLTFYLPEPSLRGITLVDTPGLGSTADKHEERSAAFLRLQHRQAEESAQLAGQADALLFMINQPVLREKDKQDILHFSRQVTTPYSIMVLVSQVDRCEEILRNGGIQGIRERSEKIFSQMAPLLQEKLAGVFPISAPLQSLCDNKTDSGAWERLKSALCTLEDDDVEFIVRSGKEAFVNSGILPQEELRALGGNIPWKVFQTILEYLIEHSVEETNVFIKQLAGIDAVREKLKDLFWQRGSLLRCCRIISDAYALIMKIQAEWPQKKREQEKLFALYARMAQVVESLSADQHVRQELEKLVRLHAPDATDRTDAIAAMCMDIDILRQNVRSYDEDFIALRRLATCADGFTEEEKNNLECLLGKFGLNLEMRFPPDRTESDRPQWLDEQEVYWREAAFNAPHGTVRHSIAERAEICCEELSYKLASSRP